MIDYAMVGPDGITDRQGDVTALRAAAEAAPEGSYVWVDFDAPADRVLSMTLKALGLDVFGTDLGPSVHRRPKVEIASGVIMLVIKTVWYIESTRQVETGDLILYTDGRTLVTVRHGLVDPVPGVRDRLAREADLRADGVGGAVYGLFDSVVEHYDGAVEDLADDVSDLEQAVFSGRRTDHNEHIYFLIRETLEFQNAVRPLAPFAHKVKLRETLLPMFERPYFHEVVEHLLRVDAAIETAMSLLTTVLTAHQGQIGTWQNDDMRKISAWAAIALVPTAIAGIYGMNFEYMPELHWTFGYPLIMAVIAVICVALYRGFKRNGWL